MVRYLCQSCNCTYINNHVCFFYKKNGNIYSLDDQNESDEKDAKIDVASDEFIEHLDDRLHPATEPKNIENLEQSNYLLIKSEEHRSSTPAVKRDKDFFSFSNKTSNNAQHGNGFYDLASSALNDQANEEDCFQNSLEIIESRSRFENVTIKPSTTAALHSETEQFNFLQKAYSEEHGMLKDGNKWHSFNKDKKIVQKSSNNPQYAPLDSNNISVTSKFPAFQQRNDECDRSTFEVPVDTADTPKLPGVTTRAVTRSMTIKRSELLVAMEVEYTVAGPSRINIDSSPEENRPFACELCPETFPSESKLKKHFQIHADKKQFICDRCDMEFAHKVTLDVHYRKHTGEKPFKCDKCGKAFTQKGNRDNHYRKHTDGRPFECDKCGKAFIKKAHLSNHFRTHTAQKSFVCDMCKKSFAYKTALEIHVRTHTGEKPYKCEICEKAFAQSGNLKTHYKFIHKLMYK